MFFFEYLSFSYLNMLLKPSKKELLFENFMSLFVFAIDIIL